MKKIQQIYIRIKSHLYLTVALQLFVAILISSVFTFQAGAAQLTARNIRISDSTPSGGAITSGVGSGTNVSYRLEFTTPNTSSTIGGIVIDFCGSSPLIGDTCATPTGFNSNRSTVTLANQTGLGAGSFSVYTADASADNTHRIILTRATAASLPGTGYIEIGNGTSNGFTNPSTTGAFYGRIFTYGTAAAAQGHSTGTGSTGYVDFGGVALTTNNVITITARVQETIIFCVFGGAAPSANCAANGSTTTPALEIGHTSTGSKKFIDSTAIDTGLAYTQISTNASSGATIRMRSSSTTGGLDSGGNSIPPANSGGATPAAFTLGQAAFGLFVANGSGGTGTVTADGGYNDGTATHYGMDSTTSGDNVITTYGDTVANATTPVSNVNNTLTFAATASNLTPAGLYSANLALIATGKF